MVIGIDRKEQLKVLLGQGVTDINELMKATNLSKNRVYELCKELRDNKVEEVEVVDTNKVITKTSPKVATSSSKMSAFIPNKDGYVKRNIGKTTDMNIFEKIYEQRTPLLLVGETGTGKSHAVRHFCFENKLPYLRINFNGSTTPEDLIGQFIPSGNGFKWIDGVLTHFVRNGGVIVIDEINSGNAEILFFLHGLTDDEKRIVLVQKDGEVIEAHKDFWLVATCNPDYEGTKPLNQALADRFIHMEFDYSANVEKELVKDKLLLDFANKCRDLYRKGELETPLSTRTLISFEKNKDIFGQNIAELFLFNRFKPVERTAIKEVYDMLMHKAKKEKDKVKAIKKTKKVTTITYP